jgi:hypothetical protein
VSSGFGPVSFATTLGGGRKSGGGSRSSSVAAYQRQVAQAQRTAAQAQQLERASMLASEFARLANIHRAEFQQSQRPAAPLPLTPDRQTYIKHYEEHYLKGIGRLQLAARTEAKRQAMATAEHALQAEWERLLGEQAKWQTVLDDMWARLWANDPDLVLQTLQEAFEDNEAPAAALAVNGNEVTLVVLIPDDSIVPDRTPTTTQTGKLTFKKITKGEQASWYAEFVCGTLLVTVREAFAVAVGIRQVRVAVLRHSPLDAYGRRTVDCLLAGRFERAKLDGVQWASASAIQIVNDASSELIMKQRGQAKQLQPVDLNGEPELANLIKSVDFDDPSHDS